jgi:hypothetical protein
MLAEPGLIMLLSSKAQKKFTLDKLAMQFLDEHSIACVIWYFSIFEAFLYLKLEWEYGLICRNYLSWKPSFMKGCLEPSGNPT